MARLSKKQQSEIRERIISEAKALFMENGYEKTSTSAIAKRVGVAEGTLFNYFPSKLEIIVEAIADEFNVSQLDYEKDIDINLLASEIIWNQLYKVYSSLFSMPKFMMKEIFYMAVQLGKKKPEQLMRLAKVDFENIEKVAELIVYLKSLGLLVPDVDEQLLSEAIFSAFIYDVCMFMYFPDMDKKTAIEQLKKRIHFTCSGFIPKKE